MKCVGITRLAESTSNPHQASYEACIGHDRPVRGLVVEKPRMKVDVKDFIKPKPAKSYPLDRDDGSRRSAPRETRFLARDAEGLDCRHMVRNRYD